MSETNPFSPKIHERLYQREAEREIIPFGESFAGVREQIMANCLENNLEFSSDRAMLDWLETGSAEVVLAHLKTIPKLDLHFGPDHGMVLQRLLEMGKAKEVMDLLLEKCTRINLAEFETVNFLMALIGAGEVERLVTLIDQSSRIITLTGDDASYCTFILLELDALGYSAAVARWVAADPNLSTKYIDSVGFDFLVTLHKRGYQDLVINLLRPHIGEQVNDHEWLDLFNRDELLTGLQQMGFVAEAEIAGKNLPVTVESPPSTKVKAKPTLESLSAAQRGEDCKKIEKAQALLVETMQMDVLVPYHTKEMHQYSKLMDQLKKVTSELGEPELKFINLMITRSGAFSETMAKVWEGVANGTQFVGQIHKTGSELHVAGMDENAFVPDALGQSKEFRPVVFLHRMNSDAAAVWQEVQAAGIPVAPVLSVIPESDNQTVVLSRYCGNTLEDWQKRLRSTVVGESLVGAAQKQSEEIIKKLENAFAEHRITHGHTHEANFTIEGIDTEYVAEQMQAGKNINTIPFDSQKFTFEPTAFVREPEKWQMVVRLIDWDRGKKQVK